MILCCELRAKIALAPSFLSEDECGVSDAAMADVMLWDVKSPNGRPTITFRFCPWCGKRWELSGRFVERQPEDS